MKKLILGLVAATAVAAAAGPRASPHADVDTKVEWAPDHGRGWCGDHATVAVS